MGNYISVDVEADGPCPGLFSMVSFGAVHVHSGASFYGQTKPITNNYDPQALAVSGHSREEHSSFEHPSVVMAEFEKWITQFEGRPVFISDNPAFDWQFINYYFHRFTGKNPFGWSARRIGDIYAGCYKSMQKPWKQNRKTKHTHHPVDDARGNAEAFLVLRDQFGIKL
jgi:hypothetical protein